jgi:hypothetical protein
MVVFKLLNHGVIIQLVLQNVIKKVLLIWVLQGV